MVPYELRELFCNDFKLPIKIYDSPLFEYYVELFDPDLGIKEKMKVFNDTIAQLKTRHDFTEEWHRVKKNIQKDIQETPAFQRFVKQEQKDIYLSPFKPQRGNTFNHKYTGQRLLSIDLVAANFNSLRFFDPSIVFGFENFSQLVAKYSDIPYYSNVKIFRQVVFEELHSNRQQTVQRQMMDKVLVILLDKYPGADLRMPSSDEIVMVIPKDKPEWEKEISDIVANHELSSVLKVEAYDLSHIVDDFFYQTFDDGRIKLRNVPAQFYSRYYKMAKGMALTDEDNYFVFEGRKAKFINEWK